MGRYVEVQDRQRVLLLPECLEDDIAEDTLKHWMAPFTFAAEEQPLSRDGDRDQPPT